jgi:hypothetical protein
VSAPNFATHYFLPSRRPFLNLSDLSDEEVLAVMEGLNDMRRQGLQHRPFGRRYLAWRRLTEARLQELFVASGGRPERTAPHYFCLGASTWFQGLADGMLSVSVRLAELPPEQTSFTLVDSFSAMGFGPQFGYPAATEPHERAVYPLSQLEGIIGRFGLPRTTATTDYATFADELVNTFVEVQLWSDDPVRHLLCDRGYGPSPGG